METDLNPVCAPPPPFDVELVGHMPKLAAFARWLTKHPDRGEDLAQDTLERAVAHRESFTPGTNMKAWLFFICRNQFYSERRRSWRMVEMAEGQAERVPCIGNAHARLELADLLQALSFLPPLISEAVLMAGEGLSYEEMAVELGCKIGTVKSLVSRGRDALDSYFGNNIKERAA